MVVVDTDDRDWERAARATAAAIRSGSHDVVYQGVFVDPDDWRGVADFIEHQPDGASPRRSSTCRYVSSPASRISATSNSTSQLSP